MVNSPYESEESLDERIEQMKVRLSELEEEGGGAECEYDYYMDELSKAVRQRAALW